MEGGVAPSVECGEQSLGKLWLSRKPVLILRPSPQDSLALRQGSGRERGNPEFRSRKRKRERGGQRTRRNREEATGQLRGVGQQLSRREGLQDCPPSRRSPGACASSAAARGRDGALLVLLRLVEI